MTVELARFADLNRVGIPAVANQTERDQLGIPEIGHRVHNLATGAIERWNGTAWAPVPLAEVVADIAALEADVTALQVGVPFFSVKAAPFLAQGDGVTDDTAAIQAAITAAVNGTAVLPGGTYMISGMLTIPGNTHLVGLGRNASVLKAMAGFPADTPMVRLGTSGVTVFGAKIKDAYVRGDGVADFGVHGDSLSVQCGLFDLVVDGCKKKCIHIEGTSDNYLMYNLMCALALSADAAAITIHLVGSAGKDRVIGANWSAAGAVPSVGIKLDGLTGHLSGLKVETLTGGGIVIGEALACHGLTIDSIQGNNLTVGDLVRIGNLQNIDVTLTGIHNEAGITATLRDNFTNLVFNDVTIGFYHTGDVNSGGVPNYPMLRPTTSTPAALAAGNNNNFALAGARTGTVRLSGDGGGTSVITGIAGGVHNRELWIYNVSANNIGLAHNDGNSTAANRILSPTAATVTLAQNDCALVRYDGVTASWRLVNWQV